ncbi:MAG: chromosome segregation protein SMC [Planctomycetia bacterium]|nr:chromosome segregation protein SMC [Planctomycetia bacterium]
MTRLTALELCGFKSFADRTRFEFPPGITVVVGPNGSGKSNVVDAIKWVLGEQSVRSLRGRDMTDVIFAGSAGRKPLNAAETSLCFDNTARRLPVEADEVRITRRVYRSGEGEYLINGEVARLRDIRELFSGTGAATEAYSVIEQGRVDALLVASGRDRRAVFEEAAGITRFRARRAEALRRLERTEQNRQRLADIVGELSGRLETVRHQATRARTFRELTDRLRHLRLAAAARDLAGVDAEAAASRRWRSRSERAVTTARDGADDAAARAAAIDREAVASAAVFEDLRNRAGALERSAAAAAATLDQVRRQRVAQEADRGTAAVEQWRADERHRAAVAAASAAAAVATTAADDEASRAAMLAEMERSIEGGQRTAADLRAQLAAHAARRESLERERQRIVAGVEQAGRHVAAARHAATAARDRTENWRRRLAEIDQVLATLEGTVASLEDRWAGAVQGVAAAEREASARGAAEAAAARDLAGWEATLSACRERALVLAELTARCEGTSDAVRRLLTAPDAAGGLAVRGLLADLIEAPLEWAPLVDVALGRLAHAVAVEDAGGPIAALARWQESAAGREACAAGGRITLVAPALLPEPASFTPGDTTGIVGRLDHLLAPGGPADGLVARLLGHAWIVDDLEVAARLAPGLPVGCLVVTRTGAVACGAAVAESGQQATATGLVARRAELKATQSRAAELERALATARAAVAEAEVARSEAERETRAARARRDLEAAALATARTDRERCRREGERAAEEAATAEAGVSAADRHATELARMEQAAAAELADHDGLIAGAGGAIARATAELDALEHAGSVAELRAARTAGIEHLARARAAAAAAAAEASRLEAERLAVEQRRRAVDDRLAGLDLDELAAGQALAAATRAAEDASLAVRDAAVLRDERLAERVRLDALAVAERERAAGLHALLHTRELEAGDARHRRERILERIREDYGIDLGASEASDEPAAATADTVPADRAALETEIEQIRRRLANMPAVNMEALTEADMLAERLAGLESQLADLTGAREAVEQLITRIDDESRRLLGDTIETVRGHFRELFTRVFGGGQADIVLDPDVDLLETSVEIVARPPGKEPRGIGLLSGGEKTMTCVALLLAIFRSRPNPFCVLDEVDAALDEANVDRFTDVLKDFRDTQFIVVTHSKKTMSAATTLYGVTMEESGVSKRVAVRLENRAVAARPRAAA